MPTDTKSTLIGYFLKHPVAPNLLLVILLFAGLLGLKLLPVRFLPNVDYDIVRVMTTWDNASAVDVEEGITLPLEQKLAGVTGLDEMSSISRHGVSQINLSFKHGTDMLLVQEEVKRETEQARELPISADTPRIIRVENYESVARLLVTHEQDLLSSLRPWVKQFKRELMDAGIDKITVYGLPKEEIAIQVPLVQLHSLGLTHQQIGQQIRNQSVDMSGGTTGQTSLARQLQLENKKHQIRGFESLRIQTDSGQSLQLSDMASIQRQQSAEQTLIYTQGKPAVEMILYRNAGGDSLNTAKILEKWLIKTRQKLPLGLEITVYNQLWQLVKQRTKLLIESGLTGMLLVIGMLYLFIHGRVALWIALGIPVSFLAALAVFSLLGGSINMISLFALIMSLGIVVDDAIVVGESAFHHFQKGKTPFQAAYYGAHKMFSPVMAASLTTIAAFFPLMLLTGTMGQMLVHIPLIVISVLVASLIECFLIMPGHLYYQFKHSSPSKNSKIRLRLESGFEQFKKKIFKPLVTLTSMHRSTTITAMVCLLFLTLGLLMSGRVGFQFFPTPEGRILHADVAFIPGTPSVEVSHFLDHIEEALFSAEQELIGSHGPRVVSTAVVRQGAIISADSSNVGDQYGSITVELTNSESREVRNPAFIRAWSKHINRQVAGLERFVIREQRGGAPGADIKVQLSGGSTQELKLASLEVQVALQQYAGVHAIQDNLDYGREQILIKPKPVSDALGLSLSRLGMQIRAAYAGYLSQILYLDSQEIEVRVGLPTAEKNRLSSLQQLNIQLPDNSSAPLSALADIEIRPGFESIRHVAGESTAEVTADVNPDIGDTRHTVAMLLQNDLPRITSKFGIDADIVGKNANQRRAMGDLILGFIVAIIAIYIILAWVLGNYRRPLLILFMIPFGLVGAVWGHYLLGIKLTLLSVFGIFGLLGLMINDIIILVVHYQDLIAKNIEQKQAVIDAALHRLRPVLLTSLTTIAGLTPLLFERSTQAQFLIPMAVSISFGLMFSTFVVLLLVPALLVGKSGQEAS